MANNEEEKRQFEAMIAATVSLGRFGRHEEVAKAVLFLPSDEARFVNGIELFVDGGAAQI